MNGQFSRLAEHWIIKAIGGAIVWLVVETVGWLPPRTAYTLLFFIVLDLMLGFGLAWWRKEVESGRMRRGALKILLYWLILLVINLLRSSQPAWEGFGQMLSTFVIGYLLITEAISILEKIAAISLHAKIDLPIVNVVLERLRAKREGS